MGTLSANQYACIIPVAGLSSRMGSFKPLLALEDGKTMIEHTIVSAFNANIGQCVVVLGFKGRQIEQHLKTVMPNANIHFLYNTCYKTTDMLYSIQLGMQYLLKSSIKASFILPGDMPRISSKTFLDLIACFEHKNAEVVLPTYQNHPKHPPLIARPCFNYIIHFNNEGGLKKALEHFLNKTYFVSIADLGCCLDADTKQAYQVVKAYKNLL